MTVAKRVTIGTIVLIVAAGGVLFIFSPDTARQPTGPFAVGEARWGPEVLAISPQRAATLVGKPRPLIHLWYPADPAARESGLMRWWRSVRRGIDGGRADAALIGLPIARGAQRFPVVLYFPGWPGTRIENYGLVCELASHGFIVAGVTYPAKLPGTSETAYQEQVRELEHWIVYTSAEVYRQAAQYSTDRVRFRAHDAIALLDGLARVDGADGSPFAHRLDLEHVGIIGFSLGGAVAAETSTMEPRIRAVVNIDGRHWGTALAGGVEQPYLFIGEELLQPSEADLTAADPDRRYNADADRFDYAQLAANLRRNGGIQVTILGTEHMNFTDSALVSRFRRLIHRNRIDPRKVLDTLNAYVLAFLQRNLMGKPTALPPADAESLADVRVEVWQR
jgi:dienelactone hydrolase